MNIHLERYKQQISEARGRYHDPEAPMPYDDGVAITLSQDLINDIKADWRRGRPPETEEEWTKVVTDVLREYQWINYIP